MKSNRSTFFYIFFPFLTLLSILFPIISCSADDASGSFLFFDSDTYMEELKQRVDRISPGIVMIIVYNDTGEETGSGSGFFIDRDGRILTNAFLLKDAYSAEVYSRLRHYTHVTILRLDQSLDLALIRVVAGNEVPLEFDPGYRAEPGESIIAVGRSRRFKETVSEGSVSSIEHTGDSLELLKIRTAPTIHFEASKDGPLLNSSGKVIGLATTRNLDNKIFGPDAIELDDSILRAVSVYSIKPFISGPLEPSRLHQAGSSDFSAWFKKSAIEGFVFLYTIGFQKIIIVLFAITLFIASLEWLYHKLKKRIKHRS